MIISASRRTDIPALYSDWFINRLNSGFLYVKNPMNRMQVTRLILSPDTIDCIVFWTKNPAAMLDKLKLLKNYPYYFQFTVTPYNSSIETGLPPRKKIIETFIMLSDIIGPERIIWRYDPVFFTPGFDRTVHLHSFEYLAKKLSGHTGTCMFSYLTVYNKCKRNMRHIQYSIPDIQDGITFATALSSIAQSQNITLKSCAMSREFAESGIVQGRCIDPALIEKISGNQICYRKDSSQRENCMCAPSVDIGVYNTCINGCIYCYANYDQRQASQNYGLHNLHSELLYGSLTGDEKITTRENSKPGKKNGQLELF